MEVIVLQTLQCRQVETPLPRREYKLPKLGGSILTSFFRFAQPPSFLRSCVSNVGRSFVS